MKKIISFILGTIVALNLSVSVANAAAKTADILKAKAIILPSNKLIIFFIISLV